MGGSQPATKFTIEQTHLGMAGWALLDSETCKTMRFDVPVDGRSNPATELEMTQAGPILNVQDAEGNISERFGGYPVKSV